MILLGLAVRFILNYSLFCPCYLLNCGQCFSNVRLLVANGISVRILSITVNGCGGVFMFRCEMCVRSYTAIYLHVNSLQVYRKPGECFQLQRWCTIAYL